MRSLGLTPRHLIQTLTSRSLPAPDIGAVCLPHTARANASTRRRVAYHPISTLFSASILFPSPLIETTSLIVKKVEARFSSMRVKKKNTPGTSKHSTELLA